MILAWGGFALAALFFAPAAVAVAKVTRTPDNDASAVAALGVAAAITQAIGLSRWVYVVPGLAETWAVDIMQRPVIETTFRTLHQFAGVGIGEAIGQTLTGLWMVGVAKSQADHPRFGKPVAILGGLGGLILLFGLGEGLATVMPFDAGLFGLAAPIGFLVLTVWLIWTGVQCIRKPALP